MEGLPGRQTGNGGTLLAEADHDRAVNKANEITGLTQRTGTWVAPAYDACGNAVTMPRPGLPGRRRGKPGDPTAPLACKYDAWNRLVEVRSGETLVAKYEYDGLGRRVKAHIDTTSPYDGTIDVYRHFYYNTAPGRRSLGEVGWQLLETRTSTAENTEPETLQPECQYVWSARYIDSPILRDKNTDTDGLCDDERLYYTTDANQNVTALVDTSGAAVERYVYDPYGKVTIYDGTWSNTRNTSSYANAILYCGYYRDAETGLYHVRNRVYNTAIGGWVQRDPLGYVDGVNLYEYCLGMPASAVDPSGEFVQVAVVVVGGGAVLTVGEVALVGVLVVDGILVATNKDFRNAQARVIEEAAGAVVDCLKNIAKGPRSRLKPPRMDPIPLNPPTTRPTDRPPTSGPVQNPIDPANPYPGTPNVEPPTPGIPSHLGASPGGGGVGGGGSSGEDPRGPTGPTGPTGTWGPAQQGGWAGYDGGGGVGGTPVWGGPPRYDKNSVWVDKNGNVHWPPQPPPPPVESVEDWMKRIKGPQQGPPPPIEDGPPTIAMDKPPC